MKRLTVKRTDGRWALANNDNARPIEQIEKIPLAIDKLAAYEDAEEQGRLIVLPCKVGDTVYKVWYAPCHNGETFPDGAGCDGCMDKCDIRKEITEFIVPNVNFIWVNFVMKGNTVYYRTREEAEKALEGMG